MANTLVIVEHRNGKVKSSSIELIAAFAQGGHTVHALLISDSTAGLVSQLETSGAKTIHTIENPCCKNYSSEIYTICTTEIAKKMKPDFVVASHTPTGRDFLPRVAIRLGAPMASDCVTVDFTKDPIEFTRPLFSGKALAKVEFTKTGTKLVTIRPNALQATPSGTEKPKVISENLDLIGTKTKVIEVTQGSLARPDVSEASIVVSGGRSLKSAENFKILEELADVLGAAVGASRAAVDAGYRPHRDQVGQTGKVVSPNLYMAFGISGAIQHLAGMRSSKVIVAVNTDPDAPIFQVADYGIVGDLFQVAPALTTQFKKLKE
jgi:electron transfer flavoprotein alpha subunit